MRYYIRASGTSGFGPAAAIACCASIAVVDSPLISDAVGKRLEVIGAECPVLLRLNGQVDAQANRIRGIESASDLGSTLAPDPRQHETHTWNSHCSALDRVTDIRANDVQLPPPRP